MKGNHWWQVGIQCRSRSLGILEKKKKRDHSAHRRPNHVAAPTSATFLVSAFYRSHVCCTRPFYGQLSKQQPCCLRCAGRVCTLQRGRLWLVPQPPPFPGGPSFSHPELTEQASSMSRQHIRTTTYSALDQAGLFAQCTPKLCS